MRRPPRPLEPEAAWGYALDLLARRALTATEVHQRLRRRAVPEPEAARIVARLRELELLDDAAYAAGYVRGRAQVHGRAVLRRDLRRKGVDEALVDAALAGGDDGPVLDDAHQAAAATALLRKHVWRYAGRAGSAPAKDGDGATAPAWAPGGDRDPDIPSRGDARAVRDAARDALRRRARAAAFLARRGFAPDAVREAVALVLGDDPNDGGDAVPE